MATTYPRAYYINVLDGVPGRVSFVTDTAQGNLYRPGGPMTLAPGRFFGKFTVEPGAIMMATAAAPTPSTATWQGSAATVTYNTSLRTLVINYGGTLPAMTTGVQPCGWVLTEHAWQLTSKDGLPDAFMGQNAVNDGFSQPSNVMPVYLVPFFKRTLTLSLEPVPMSSTVTGDYASDVTHTIVFDKPLNPFQSVTARWVTQITAPPASAGPPAYYALPEAVRVNANWDAVTLNAQGQAVSATLRIPLSLAPAGYIVPGRSYALGVKVSHPLTYLKGDAIVTEDIDIIPFTTLVASVATSVVGPTISSATVAPVNGEGLVYHSPVLGLDCYLGKVAVTYEATHPNGVSMDGVTATANSGSVVPDTMPSLSVVSTGGNGYRATFSTADAESLTYPYPLPDAGTTTPRWSAYDHRPVTLNVKSSASTPVYSSRAIPLGPYFANLQAAHPMFYGSGATDNVLTPTYVSTHPSYVGLNVLWSRLPIPMVFVDNIRVRLVQNSNGAVLSDKTIYYALDVNVPYGPTAVYGRKSDRATTEPWHYLRNNFNDLSVDVGLTLSTLNTGLLGPVPINNSSTMHIHLTVTDRLGNVRTYISTFFAQSIYVYAGGGGGGCVPYTAQVLMADGSTQDAGLVTEGSLLMTRNALTGELEACAVAEVLPKGVQPCVKLTYTDGTSRECSTTHRVFVDTDTSYYEAKDLQVGMTLLAADGPRTIASVEPAVEQPVLTFSMETEANRNYFADDMLAHNMKSNDCVVAGTPISMADGTTKPVESLIPGESVLSFDETTMAFRPGLVYSRFATTATRLFTVSLVNGATVTCSPTHMFKTQDAWIRAEALFLMEPDACPTLLVEDGSFQAVGHIASADHPEGVKVYLVEVEHDHDLVAGGIACHNAEAKTPTLD